MNTLQAYGLLFSSVRNIFAWNLKKMGNWCLIKDFLLDFSDCNLKHFMQMPFRLFPLSNFCHMVWTKVLKSSEFGIKWIPSQISKVTFTNLGDFSRLPEREWKTLKLWSSVKEVSDWAKVEPMGVKLANITLYNFFIQRWVLLSYPLILSYLIRTKIWMRMRCSWLAEFNYANWSRKLNIVLCFIRLWIEEEDKK